jgi:hypothetical protein
MALSERVSVAVTKREKRALTWVARKLLLQRYPHGTKRTERPGAGAVLRQMSVADALARYEARPGAKKEPEVAVASP